MSYLQKKQEVNTTNGCLPPILYFVALRPSLWFHHGVGFHAYDARELVVEI